MQQNEKPEAVRVVASGSPSDAVAYFETELAPAELA
jgi:hypothetical protein